MFRPAMALMVSALVWLVAACGGGAASPGDPAQLQQSAFEVTAISVAGQDLTVLEPVVITFTEDSVSVGTPCNGLSGPAEFSDTTITVGALAATKMACEPALMAQDQVLADAMAANPTWALANGELTLTGGTTVITAESVTEDVSP